MAEILASSQATLVENNAQLEKAYRLQGEFVSMISHELRSPLHSVQGYLEFIQEDELGLSARTHKNLAAIGASAKRLLALVNDILDFSKLEARQIGGEAHPLRAQPRSAASGARGRCQALDSGARNQSSSWKRRTQIYLESDEARLRQILTNLMSNAIKFTDRGVVTLGARVAGDRVELSVRDTGIGIPAEQLTMVFRPFRQAKSAGTRAAKRYRARASHCRAPCRADWWKDLSRE